MANRVCFGRLSASRIGLFISKPGFNVLTAAEINMLFASEFKALQFVQTGRVAVANGGSTAISFPNLGYLPLIVVLPHISAINANGGNEATTDLGIGTEVTNLTNSTARIGFGCSPHYTYEGFCTYAVLREQING